MPCTRSSLLGSGRVAVVVGPLGAVIGKFAKALDPIVAVGWCSDDETALLVPAGFAARSEAHLRLIYQGWLIIAAVPLARPLSSTSVKMILRSIRRGSARHLRSASCPKPTRRRGCPTPMVVR